MESRQKRLQALSQQSKRLKHESAILPVDKSKNESSCKVEVTPIISYKNAKKTPLSGPIVNCFRKQKEKQERKVSCPICTNIISYDDINNHLDNDCKRLTTEQGCDDVNHECSNDDDCQITQISSACTSNEHGLAQQEDFNEIVWLDCIDSPNDNLSQFGSLENDNNNESIIPADESYLQNFLVVLTTVMSEKDDKQLFNDDDNTVVKTFQNMTCNSKTLYVRLFQRKYKWFRTNSIKYPRISKNLQPCFDELIKAGFLHTEAELDDLTEIFNLLFVAEVQELAKSMHITIKTRSKKYLVDALMEKTKTQRSLFSSSGDCIKKAIMKRAKNLLGSCIKLKYEERNVFSRVILLFTLNLIQDDENYGLQLYRSSIFSTNIGKIVYPSYEICRQTAIFKDRDDVINYDLASQDLYHMEDEIDHKNFDEARKIYYKIYPQFVEALKKLASGDPRLIYSVNLPVHLRRFTAPWLYTRMCSRAVEVLQRYKEYDDVNQLLRLLLKQKEFCPNHRGRWWDRLALNLDQHLKKPAEALDVVRTALADVNVKTGHRLALEERARKICERKRHLSLKKFLSEIKFTELREANIATISGKRLEQVPMFVVRDVDSDDSDNNEVISYCAVEELALKHYKKCGYLEGIHGEGLTFSSLFSLLMWDVLFANIPDVFRTSFQAAPLDIYCDNFYENRQEIIDERLEEIRNASDEKIQQNSMFRAEALRLDLREWITKKWIENYGKVCQGVKWELFSGVGQITRLAQCIGSSIIAGICEILVKNYRHTRSGLPDLVVWNSKTRTYKVVEVKGPNDKLSAKQKVWLDSLLKLGVNAEVLYVRAVGGRRL